MLGQLFGVAKACAMVNEAIQVATKKPPCFAVEALRELTKLAEVVLRVDGGASHIGKTRSRQFFDALESKCDVWVSIDDDVSASRETLGALLAAVARPGAHIVSAPCLLRGENRVNVQFANVVVESRLTGGATLQNIVSSGFGLVAMNREAMQLVASASPTWKDPHDGKVKPAPFLEILESDGTWVGEDIAFFRRVPRGSKGVSVEALTTGKTVHAGHELALESLRV